MKILELCKYLAGRTLLLVCCIVGISLFSIIYLIFAAIFSLPIWPGVVALLILGGLCFGFVQYIVVPYIHGERMILLFLDGYSLSGLALGQRVPFSAGNERLFQRMEENFSTSELMKLNKRQAQYLALQNQINPHFLYNTLESIRSEALISGLDSVADMTEALAMFFRYTISKVENLVSVEDELQNCETYFKIQQYRFGSRLELEIVCDSEEREEIYRYRIPKLTIQPILENSIIHGTENKIGVGHLKIRLERTKKRLMIIISDDGVGMDEQTLVKVNEQLGKSKLAFSQKNQDTGGVALVNVDNRIQLLFGEEYGLHVYSARGVGTEVEIVIPAITSDREITNQEALK